MAKQSGSVVDLPVKVTSAHDKVIETNLKVHRWSVEERTARVWKRLGMWGGGAMVAAVVPPHIPWFVIGMTGAPVAAWLASRQRALIEAQTIPCPDCGTPAEIEEQAENWPLGARCKPCGNVFWTSPIEPRHLDG